MSADEARIYSAILAMAAAGYVTKLLGVRLLAVRNMHPFVRAFLHNAPAAVLLAVVVPVVLHGGIPMFVAAVMTGVVSFRTGSLLLAMLVGVGCFAIAELTVSAMS